MKKIFALLVAVFMAAALAGCSAGYTPASLPNNNRNYSPNPNNVNFNDGNLTTNFATDNPNYAMPGINGTGGGGNPR